MNQTDTLPRTDLIERLLAEGVKSGCSVPLKSGSTIIGTFNVGSSRTYAFNSETEQLLTAVGADLGALLENSSIPSAQPITTGVGQIPFSAATNGLLLSALVERVRAGDVTLFRELVKPYEKAVYSIALSIVRDRAEAEDVAQETVLKALTHLYQLHAPGKFRQWLLQIALNEARMRRRQNKSYLHEPLDPIDGSSLLSIAPATDPIEQREFQAAFSRALSSLPLHYREIVILRDLQDRTVSEIAAVLGISTACVKIRLHRARKALGSSLPAEFRRAA